MHWFIWITAAVLLGLWTLACWAVAAVLGLDPNWVGDLRPLLERLPETLPLAAWLDAWLPGWHALTLAVLDLVRASLGWLGASATLIAWLAWAAGALCLLAGAALGSLLWAMLPKVPQPKAATTST